MQIESTPVLFDMLSRLPSNPAKRARRPSIKSKASIETVMSTTSRPASSYRGVHEVHHSLRPVHSLGHCSAISKVCGFTSLVSHLLLTSARPRPFAAAAVKLVSAGSAAAARLLSLFGSQTCFLRPLALSLPLASISRCFSVPTSVLPSWRCHNWTRCPGTRLSRTPGLHQY
jgi:hypothetical protein